MFVDLVSWEELLVVSLDLDFVEVAGESAVAVLRLVLGGLAQCVLELVAAEGLPSSPVYS